MGLLFALEWALHWGKSQLGSGQALGCTKEEQVKGSWVAICPFLAVVDAQDVLGIIQAVLPIGWPAEAHSLGGSVPPGKAYEITYVRLKFHTSRPESFAIYKRSRAGGPWEPFQFYSASCQKTYGKRPRQYLRPGEDEQVAFCSDEFSDISPLSGGNVAFSTLEGRPSAYNFDGSPALQVPPGWEGVDLGSKGILTPTRGKSAGDVLQPCLKSCRVCPGWGGRWWPRPFHQGALPMSPAGVGDSH